jgi:hypothetical protein
MVAVAMAVAEGAAAMVVAAAVAAVVANLSIPGRHR